MAWLGSKFILVVLPIMLVLRTLLDAARGRGANWSLAVLIQTLVLSGVLVAVVVTYDFYRARYHLRKAVELADSLPDVPEPFA